MNKLMYSFGLCLLAVNTVHAEVVRQIGSHDAVNQSGWLDAALWSDGLVPSSSNDYVNDTPNMDTRPPQSSVEPSPLFLGNSLTLTNGARFVTKFTGTATVPDLRIAGGCSLNLVSGRALAGNLNLNGTGTITFNAAAENRTLRIDSHITVGSGIGTIMTDLPLNKAFARKTSGFEITNPNNTFSGLWDVNGGYLKGSGFGAGSFKVGEWGFLDFDSAYSNITASFTVMVNSTNSSMGGLVLLDHNITVGTATIWGEELAADVYTGAELKSHAIYGNAFDVDSLDHATLTVLFDPQPLLRHVENISLLSNPGSIFALSVYPGKASYDGTVGGGVAGIIGDGSVTDYAFYNNNGSLLSGGVYTLNKYSSGLAGVIGDATATITSGSQSLNAKLWTETDPGMDFSSLTPDYGTDYPLFARVTGVTNTLSISRYAAGSVYVLYGSHVDITTVTATMSGPGQSDLTVPPVILGHGYNISRFDFSNAELYNKITVTYDNADLDASPASRARYMGIIFSGVPLPPSGTIIIVN